MKLMGIKIAEKYPKELIGMISDHPVAMKAPAVVELVATIALEALLKV